MELDKEVVKWIYNRIDNLPIRGGEAVDCVVVKQKLKEYLEQEESSDNQ